MATQPGQDRIIRVDSGGAGTKGALVDAKAGKLATSRARLSSPQPATPSPVAKTGAEVLEQIDADGPAGLTLPGPPGGAGRDGRDASRP